MVAKRAIERVASLFGTFLRKRDPGTGAPVMGARFDIKEDFKVRGLLSTSQLLSARLVPT